MKLISLIIILLSIQLLGQGLENEMPFNKNHIPNSNVPNSHQLDLALRLNSSYNSTSVVDSVVVHKRDGTLEKYIYTYTGDGMSLSSNVMLSDGVEFEMFERENYSYNVEGELIFYLKEKWDDSRWTLLQENKFEYNNLGLLHKTNQIKILGGQYIDTSRTSFEYDHNSNMTLHMREQLIDGIWTNSMRTRMDYNSESKKILDVHERWYTDTWEGIEKKTMTYDQRSNMISYKEETWDNGWMNSSRALYSYDEMDNVTVRIGEYWKDDNWVPDDKFTYSYDVDYKWEFTLWQIYEDGDWKNRKREVYGYNDNQEMILKEWEDWKDTIWVKDRQWSYAYDINGNMISSLYEIWDNDDLVPSRKRNYNYNNLGEIIQFFNERWNGDSWGKSDSYSSFYDSFERFHEYEGYLIDIFYSQITDMKESLLSISFFELHQNYPNPFNPSTKISYSIPNQSHVSLKVFDVLGREITSLVNKEQSTGNYEAEFDASNLTSGIYFYRIQAGQFVESKKMVLMK